MAGEDTEEEEDPDIYMDCRVMAIKFLPAQYLCIERAL